MFERGLLISLPAQELPSASSAGSIVDAEDLNLQAASSELRDAITLIQTFAAYNRVSIRFIFRPEMFTNGSSLAWLRDQVGSTDSHIALSDGSTAKLVPGMRNYIFLYGQARLTDFTSLLKLAQRVPELFVSFDAQINTAFSVTRGPRVFCPPTIVVTSESENKSKDCQLLNLFLTPFSAADCMQRILIRGAVPPPQKPFQNLVYAPVTETALGDAAFVKRLTKALTSAMFEETKALVLALPTAAPNDRDFTQRLHLLLETLQRSGASVPPASTNNLFVATGRLSANHLHPIGQVRTLMTHASYDFWRAATSFYTCFHSIKVFADLEYLRASAFEQALSAMCGRDVDIEWSTPVKYERA